MHTSIRRRPDGNLHGFRSSSVLCCGQAVNIFGGAWKNHEEENQSRLDFSGAAGGLRRSAGRSFLGAPYGGSRRRSPVSPRAAGDKNIIKRESRSLVDYIEENGRMEAALRVFFPDLSLQRQCCRTLLRQDLRNRRNARLALPGDSEYKAQTDEKIYLREAGRLRGSLEKANRLLDAVPEEERGEIIVFLHYPPYGQQQKDTLFTQCIEENNIKNCYYGHIHGFTDADRAEARRTGVQLRENGTRYSLVSCDYTGNHLIRIAE